MTLCNVLLAALSFDLLFKIRQHYRRHFQTEFSIIFMSFYACMISVLSSINFRDKNNNTLLD